MRIGIDISALQGPHRMRGIGSALLHFINNISEEDRKNHSFVFFVLPDSETSFGDPLKLLDTKGISFEVRYMKLPDRLNTHLPPKKGLLPGRIHNVFNSFYGLRDYYLGDPREYDLGGLDVYVQPDQSQSLPRKRGFKKVLIIYDMIPYVLDGDYLTSYHVARERGYSFKGSVRLGLHRWMYTHKLKQNTRHADRLLSISEHTKQDFIKYIHTKDSKIVVIPLGVEPPNPTLRKAPPLHCYTPSSWGYLKQHYALPESTPFLLFVGGADRRRKLNDLVSAFNHLRAEGHEIKLVLCGDIMQGPNNIPTEETQLALKRSSYLEDIVFMGFIDDETRDWLYRGALAFIYPSRYEGFGLPVLEAMSYGCPVVCYSNGAVREIGGEAPLYAEDAAGIYQHIVDLLNADEKTIGKLREECIKQANKFSWGKTADEMIKAIIK